MMFLKSWRKYFILIIAFLGVSGVLYFCGGKEIRYQKKATPMIEVNGSVPEINVNTTICQRFKTDDDFIEKMTLRIGTYGRECSGIALLRIIDEESNQILAEHKIDTSLLKDNTTYEWEFEEPIKVFGGEDLFLQVTSDSQEGKGITLYFNQNTNEQGTELYVNGQAVSGEIAFSIQTLKDYFFGRNYWYITFGALSILVGYCIVSDYKKRRGKVTLLVKMQRVWEKYKFLIKQLILRDFKTKYKRSVLGYIWSFLNPLLSMIVQYIVFSTIFKSDIDNFPVYLLSGIILFNFFADAVSQGLVAIVANSSLITKVYVPKYIYPVTKVFSTSINLLISIIPLFIIMLLTKENFTKAIFLLPFPILCLLVFSIGLSLVLCSAMVFFRDTQYLWGILNLAWTYATPIFYPANIIPEKYVFIQKLNPLFHYISFVRTLLIAGESPAAIEYFYCMMFSLIMLLIGIIIFKKTQDKFILFI